MLIAIPIGTPTATSTNRLRTKNSGCAPPSSRTNVAVNGTSRPCAPNRDQPPSRVPVSRVMIRENNPGPRNSAHATATTTPKLKQTAKRNPSRRDRTTVACTDTSAEIGAK
jgi:hypothetical protein